VDLFERLLPPPTADHLRNQTAAFCACSHPLPGPAGQTGLLESGCADFGGRVSASAQWPTGGGAATTSNGWRTLHSQLVRSPLFAEVRRLCPSVSPSVTRLAFTPRPWNRRRPIPPLSGMLDEAIGAKLGA